MGRTQESCSERLPCAPWCDRCFSNHRPPVRALPPEYSHASASQVLATTLSFVAGHASMIMPPTRNAIDSTLPGWSDGKHPETGWIEPYDCACTNGTEAACNSGQSCFWFSQGCTVGCKTCDGQGQRYPSWDHCPGTPSPAKDPFYLDKKYWTANQDATPGSFADIWRFHPWRAPGHAPVWDACGMAGGTTHEVFNAGAYNATAFAKQGDLGSVVLKPRPSGTVWKRGSTVKARWQMTAQHGGGCMVAGIRTRPYTHDASVMLASRALSCFAQTSSGSAARTRRSLRLASRRPRSHSPTRSNTRCRTGRVPWPKPCPRCPRPQQPSPHAPWPH